jgi:hypothetical protein
VVYCCLLIVCLPHAIRYRSSMFACWCIDPWLGGQTVVGTWIQIHIVHKYRSWFSTDD